MDKDTCELMEDLINSERRIYKAYLDGKVMLPPFRAEQARKRLLRHTELVLEHDD